ncbi:MAG: hypothetical protein WEC33_00260 [Dehalococcoidia bacterium]
MAELKDSAEQFAKDLIAQNIAGLMMVFTPNGMSKAMAMQAQMASQPQVPAIGFEVKVGAQEGEDHLVDIVMKNADGEGVIQTKWKDVAGAWKVDDIGLKTA